MSEKEPLDQLLPTQQELLQIYRDDILKNQQSSASTIATRVNQACRTNWKTPYVKNARKGLKKALEKNNLTDDLELISQWEKLPPAQVGRIRQEKPLSDYSQEKDAYAHGPFREGEAQLSGNPKSPQFAELFTELVEAWQLSDPDKVLTNDEIALFYQKKYQTLPTSQAISTFLAELFLDPALNPEWLTARSRLIQSQAGRKGGVMNNKRPND